MSCQKYADTNLWGNIVARTTREISMRQTKLIYYWLAAQTHPRIAKHNTHIIISKYFNTASLHRSAKHSLCWAQNNFLYRVVNIMHWKQTWGLHLYHDFWPHEAHTRHTRAITVNQTAVLHSEEDVTSAFLAGSLLATDRLKRLDCLRSMKIPISSWRHRWQEW